MSSPKTTPLAHDRLDDRNIESFDEIPRPRELKDELAPDTDRLATVSKGRADITAALNGQDDRMLVVVGPCSIHDSEIAREYARRLTQQAALHAGELIVVMRTYFEKPRTSIGWKGLIYDPFLDGSYDAARGLRSARQVLLDVTGMGLPCAVEVLDTITPQYYTDLVSWAAIGARTVESQVHRQLASGLSMPVGFKNATDGRVDVALNALSAAISPHAFFGVGEDGQSTIVRTTGNAASHVVLRGGDNGPNFARDIVLDAAKGAQAITGHARPIVVDCSHGNSGKDHTRQSLVVDDLIAQWSQPDHGILGLMLESNLLPGRQDWEPGSKLEHGVSITDACVGWDETVELLDLCAQAVAAAR